MYFRQQPVCTVVHWSRQQPKESFVDVIWWLVHRWNSRPNACCDFSNCCSTFIHEHPPTGFKCTCLIFMCVVVFWSFIHGLTIEFFCFVSVGDIPGPPRSQRSGVTRRAQSREELSSTGGSPRPLQPQTRTVSRSISVSVLPTNYMVQNMFWVITSYLAGQDIPCFTEHQHCTQPTSYLHSLRLSIQFHIFLHFNPWYKQSFPSVFHWIFCMNFVHPPSPMSLTKV